MGFPSLTSKLRYPITLGTGTGAAFPTGLGVPAHWVSEDKRQDRPLLAV